MDEAVHSAEKALTLSSGSPFYLCAVGAAYAAAGKETQHAMFSINWNRQPHIVTSRLTIAR